MIGSGAVSGLVRNWCKFVKNTRVEPMAPPDTAAEGGSGAATASQRVNAFRAVVPVLRTTYAVTQHDQGQQVFNTVRQPAILRMDPDSYPSEDKSVQTAGHVAIEMTEMMKKYEGGIRNRIVRNDPNERYHDADEEAARFSCGF